MLTFVACSIEEQRRIMSSCNHHPLYLTGSRPVAEAIKGLLPATFSSTGGPNTMVVTDPSEEEVQQAIRWSTLIENSGQCTALRHVVMPAASSDTVETIFRSDKMLEVEEPKDSLEKAEFAGQFREWGGTFPEVSGYTRLGSGEPVAFRVNEDEAFPYGIDEQWRRAFIDVTTPGASEDLKSTAFLDKLATWLKTEQPITLSVNGDDPEEGYPIMSSLFERTAQVVYTVGNKGAPSLSCQARPQDGEIFGEFPPRKDLSRFTKTPVVVPSSTPSYNSTYNAEYLENTTDLAGRNIPLRGFIDSTDNAKMKGYLTLLSEYLLDACEPKTTYGERTALWGLQRPPMHDDKSLTVIRGASGATFDVIAPYILPFYATNAHNQVIVSCAEDHLATRVAEATEKLGGIRVEVETDKEFERSSADAWNIVEIDARESAAPETMPLVGQFASLLFPLGHIKSTLPNDEKFVAAFSASPKWLMMR